MNDMEGTSTKHFQLLFFAVTLMVSVSVAQPVMLTDSLSTISGEFVLTAQGAVVFINSNGVLSSVNIDDPFNTESFSVGWVPEDDGWSGTGEIKLLKSSPDGNLVCLAIQVSIPDSVLNRGLSMPEPIVIIVCNAAGGGAQVVGVTTDSGNKLSFDFTQDSRLLYGAGFLPCNPDLESYFGHYLGDESSSLRPFDLIDLEEGARFSSNGIIGDYFTGNPWSDLIASGPAPLTTIADIAVFSIIFQDSTLTSPVIDQWIEPDAGLAQIDGPQIIRFSDGTIYESQEEPFLILCRISEGNYIFSRNQGESIRRGRVNWSTFEEQETTELTELMGYISLNSRIKALNSGTAIVFSAGRGLYYYEF